MNKILYIMDFESAWNKLTWNILLLSIRCYCMQLTIEIDPAIAFVKALAIICIVRWCNLKFKLSMRIFLALN